MSPTRICASAASGALGKKGMKSLYSCSAWVRAAVPPSLYQLSAIARLAFIWFCESGDVEVAALGGVEGLVVEHLVGKSGVDRLDLLLLLHLLLGVFGLHNLLA